MQKVHYPKEMPIRASLELSDFSAAAATRYSTGLLEARGQGRSCAVKVHLHAMFQLASAIISVNSPPDGLFPFVQYYER